MLIKFKNFALLSILFFKLQWILRLYCVLLHIHFILNSVKTVSTQHESILNDSIYSHNNNRVVCLQIRNDVISACIVNNRKNIFDITIMGFGSSLSLIIAQCLIDERAESRQCKTGSQMKELTPVLRIYYNTSIVAVWRYTKNYMLLCYIRLKYRNQEIDQEQLPTLFCESWRLITLKLFKKICTLHFFYFSTNVSNWIIYQNWPLKKVPLNTMNFSSYI